MQESPDIYSQVVLRCDVNFCDKRRRLSHSLLFAHPCCQSRLRHTVWVECIVLVHMDGELSSCSTSPRKLRVDAIHGRSTGRRSRNVTIHHLSPNAYPKLEALIYGMGSGILPHLSACASRPGPSCSASSTFGVSGMGLFTIQPPNGQDYFSHDGTSFCSLAVSPRAKKHIVMECTDQVSISHGASIQRTLESK